MFANRAVSRDTPIGWRDFLLGYSVEVTSGDRTSIEAAGTMLAPGTEIFVASLPKDTSERQLAAAAKLHQTGLIPVPHLVARNIVDAAEFETIVRRLVAEAGVDRVLVLAGDRDRPAGGFHSSLQLIETGVLQRNGIRRIFISAYPEVHPRITPTDLVTARAAKLAAAESAGFAVTLVSQFCFDAAAVVSLASQLRAEGIKAPLRVGVAGPAGRATLLKYALMCGVGPSIRALKGNQSMARNMLAGESPESLLAEVAGARAANPSLGIQGVHFFTFASLAATVQWVNGSMGE